MKKILRDTCVLSALMILCVFGISVLWSGITAEIRLVFQLFGLSLLICVANRLFDEFTDVSMICSYIIKYFGACALVMLYGFIAGWFYRSNFWMVFIYVAAVLALACCLDLFRTQRDIAYINARIRASRDERQAEQ